MFSVSERLHCYARRGTEFEKRCLSVPQRDGVSRLRHESFGLSLQQVSNCETVCVYASVCTLCGGTCVCVYPGDLDTTLGLTQLCFIHVFILLNEFTTDTA